MNLLNNVYERHKYAHWTYKSKVDLTCWVKGQRVSQDSKHSFALVPVGPSVVAGPLRLLTQHLWHDTVHVGADQAQTVKIRAQIRKSRRSPLPDWTQGWQPCWGTLRWRLLPRGAKPLARHSLLWQDLGWGLLRRKLRRRWLLLTDGLQKVLVVLQGLWGGLLRWWGRGLLLLLLGLLLLRRRWLWLWRRLLLLHCLGLGQSLSWGLQGIVRDRLGSWRSTGGLQLSRVCRRHRVPPLDQGRSLLGFSHVESWEKVDDILHLLVSRQVHPLVLKHWAIGQLALLGRVRGAGQAAHLQDALQPPITVAQTLGLILRATGC